MKKWISLLLVLCMLLSACGPAGTEQPGETVDSDVQTGEGSTSSVQEETTATERPSLDHEIVITAPIGGVGIPDSDLVLGESGRIRIDYTGDRNSVRYVTDVTGIPAYPELAGYDEAYFAEKALLLVIVTEGSGSIRPQICSVKTDDQTATVYLDHSMEGDVGTADMATWLLWVELEAGLEYQWKLAGRTIQQDHMYTS